MPKKNTNSRPYDYNCGDLIACYTHVESDGKTPIIDPIYGLSYQNDVIYKRVILGWIEGRTTDGDGLQFYYVHWSDRPAREPMCISEKEILPLRKLYFDVRNGHVSDGIIMETRKK